MARMNVRATYALDQETASRIRRLAGLWGVSQAEVIRRSVERAALAEDANAPTPAEVVAYYADHPPPRSRSDSRALVDAARRLRHEDDARRAGSS